MLNLLLVLVLVVAATCTAVVVTLIEQARQPIQRPPSTWWQRLLGAVMALMALGWTALILRSVVYLPASWLLPRLLLAPSDSLAVPLGILVMLGLALSGWLLCRPVLILGLRYGIWLAWGWRLRWS